MAKKVLYDSLFELADIWTVDIDPEEYFLFYFLKTIFRIADFYDILFFKISKELILGSLKIIYIYILK